MQSVIMHQCHRLQGHILKLHICIEIQHCHQFLTFMPIANSNQLNYIWRQLAAYGCHIQHRGHLDHKSATTAGQGRNHFNYIWPAFFQRIQSAATVSTAGGIDEGYVIMWQIGKEIPTVGIYHIDIIQPQDSSVIYERTGNHRVNLNSGNM